MAADVSSYLDMMPPLEGDRKIHGVLWDAGMTKACLGVLENPAANVAALVDQIADSDEAFVDSDFMLNEFVDRFGPRLHHLNSLLQVLSQLGSVANPPANSAE